MLSQTGKAQAFRVLHEEPGIFVIPNPWDVGSAKILAGLGYKALTTTSSGMAWSMGLLDGQVTREAFLEHCRLLAAATDLPLAADMEDGFVDTPEGVAETIRIGAEAGLVGGSVEDWYPASRNNGEPRIQRLEEAVERVQAAAEAARALPHDFLLVARAENHIRGVTALDDTIKRLQAYQEAGADVLYAPGLANLDEVRSVVQSVDRPVNVLVGAGLDRNTVAQLAEVGVKRISVGGAFANAAYSAFLRAAKEVMAEGVFTFRREATGGKEIGALIAGKP